ncbi:Hypothetical sugar kinase in cluster with indigoidine synthase indA, PfkB family of kinases [Marinilactibacillus psychrotolerans 42ea]|uniref:Ribokinase n=1 Tax=Marinilactibacillus psychrotolerans 42ea TaxID=1255609 RepID=A0A1R4KFK1_9LACT|nr:PfkB family carbohydrate kinase [Marinilactibacillus psychrotolerans]SJN43007.1 Hypothetical sugar kinase in cluster with indigoidine synthase indA, PfkB family of kinases [Marinilactibacillus psychrotolerans 42ea]
MNIKDIAKLAGVSASTVSKIVNKKDQSISKTTRERVLKIVNEYNYTPYSSGINTTTSTGIIGVLINSSIVNNSTLNGIICETQNRGYSPLILNSYEELDQELKNITSLVNKQVDGIIWEPVNSEDSKNKNYLNSLGIPIVLLGDFEDAVSLKLPNEMAAYFLTNQLIINKHEKIACIIDKKIKNKAFITGYKKALFEHNLPFHESLIISHLDKTINDFIINGQITGIVSSHFNKSIELQDLTTRSGLKPPQNYSLISIRNDYDFQFHNNENKISTVTLNNSNFGKHICRTLLNLIANIDTIEPYEEKIELDNLNSIGFPHNYTKAKILVIGSINMDTYLYSPKLPYKGTPNFLSSLTKLPGGKGFNQAIGTANLGEEVRLIGCLGSDMNSNVIFQELEKKEISTSGLNRSDDTDTGQAYVFVESSGDSIISILPGANSDLSPKQISKNKNLFSGAKFCLIQTEIPIESVERACFIAKELSIKIILKPSASELIPDTILDKIDYFIPNEDEISYLCPNLNTIEEKAEYLLAKGVKCVIVTLGKKGCLLKTANIEKYFPASDFTATDSTGASDAFISALASYLLKEYSLEKAIQIAIIAAGFSVSRDGVINSLVDNNTLESYIAKKNPELLVKS